MPTVCLCQVNPSTLIVEENVDNPSSKFVESSNHIIKKRKTTNTLLNYIPRKMTNTYQSQLDDSLLKLIYLDCQPFSITENEGFKQFVNLLNPAYKLPSRHKLSKTSLPFAYEKLFNETKLKVQEEALSVCLTTDCWTSINNTSFLAVTAHYVDPNFNLKSVLLQCAPFTEKHTSLNLSIIIQSIIDEWQLKDKIVLVVSDNAANIKGAISKLELKHFGCFAHSLNLIVQGALKCIVYRYQFCFVLFFKFVLLLNKVV